MMNSGDSQSPRVCRSACLIGRGVGNKRRVWGGFGLKSLVVSRPFGLKKPSKTAQKPLKNRPNLYRITTIMLNMVVFRTPQPSIIFTVSSLYKIINTLFFNLTHTIMQIRKSMLFIGDDYYVLIDMGTKMQTFQTD